MYCMKFGRNSETQPVTKSEICLFQIGRYGVLSEMALFMLLRVVPDVSELIRTHDIQHTDYPGYVGNILLGIAFMTIHEQLDRRIKKEMER